MNYKVVVDENELKKFIDFLPDLTENETYYLCLFARNKYCKDVKHISSDKAQLKRFLTNKERMFNKIKQLEVEMGQYYQFRNNEKVEIPQEALALYINPNPRDQYKAIFPTMKNFLDIINCQGKGFNLVQETLSQVQRTKSRSIYYNVDFDIEKSRFKEVKETVSTIINEDALNWIETRGGYHCLVELDKIQYELKNKWFQAISKIEGVEMIKDTMLPVLGCYQGGFTPKFVNNE